ncbi:MAG: PQQ-dependent sugar dehydrogenase [Pseudomonadales bacterium]|jgi:glucose/arabinose dehydrogenase|nr:PQQ-dependent sugar dehydrogenase [Pseudomonadales bacterium]
MHFNRLVLPALLGASLLLSHGAAAQFGSAPLGAGPWDMQTYQAKINVSVVARGLAHPWSFAFLPNGDLLLTEREGRLRLMHDGKLTPEAIAGVPSVHAEGMLGLMEVLPHPEFVRNQYLYLTYHKKLSDDPKAIAFVLARAHFTGNALTDLQELLVSDTWDGAGGGAARLAFGTDGKLYMSLGATRDGAAQETNSLRGKILRLNEDGSVPADNPFVGKQGYRPEIYSMGHRNPAGLAVHPTTGELWESEYGPNGGDEINIIRAGKNYGWPLVSFGRDYPGPFISSVPWKEGMEMPVATFSPGISPSGLAFYTGKDFPTWTTSAFVGASRVGQIPGTGRMVRVFFDANGDERSREDLFTELKQRIRDIRMGPDGLMYFLTEEQDGALLVIKLAAK